MRLLWIFAWLPLATPERDIEAEKTPEFWTSIAQQELEASLAVEVPNKRIAKNIILFLGDGMGVSTITAGRIYKAQKRGTGGEETKLAMDKFPHVALSRTYSTDRQVSDSAATATAFLCGVKTNYYVLGMSAAAEQSICQTSKGTEVSSILVDFYKAGKSTGVVTTTRVNHATPGATYAHTPSRTWYGDADLSDEASQFGCKDIAMQLYDSAEMMTVVLGGGRKYFQPNTTTDPEYPTKFNARLDGNDLIEMWQNKMTNDGHTHQYVWNKEQFDDVDVSVTDRLLGLFEPGDMQYEANRAADSAKEPSLAEMTEKAIGMLKKNENGYFLLVEGGRIDHGHHASSAYLSLNDVVAFDDAIEKAVRLTSQEDTMIIVTADHSHVFTIGGYSERGNDILGLAPSNIAPALAFDEKSYTTLLYSNGPGFQGHYYYDDKGYAVTNLSNTERMNVSDFVTSGSKYIQQSAVPLDSETHGGEDVAIFARGPMAHLFHGVHEQHYIAHAMRYAACVGSLDTDRCSKTDGKSGSNQNSATEQTYRPKLVYFGRQISAEEAENILKLQFAFLLVLTMLILLMIVFIFICRKRFKASMKRFSGRDIGAHL